MRIKICELCGDEAAVHCASDSAYLCSGCDAKVHGANFLVARHVRRPICSRCGSLASPCFSGAGAGCGPAICRTCEEFESDSESSSSSSACISGTGSAVSKKRRDRKADRNNRISTSSSVTEGGATERFSGEVDSRRRRSGDSTSFVDQKAEGVLVIWFRRLGFSEGEAMDRANRALGFCGGKMTIVPLRVLLAAAAWLSLSACGDRRMKRLEEVSGVPRRMILALGAKLARVNRGVVSVGCSDLEEGWAECSP